MAAGAAAASGAGSAVGAIVGGILSHYSNRETLNTMEDLQYDYRTYLRDLYYAFGPQGKGLANDYLTMEFDRFPGLPEKQLGRYAAPMTDDQTDIINRILATRDEPRALNLEAEDQLHQTIAGQYLPGSGQENPYTQSLMDAIHRSSVRGLEDQGPMFQRQLQSIAGGALRGAGSSMPSISNFYGDWIQRAGDLETSVLQAEWGRGRGDQMQALNWALGMPTGLETQRLGALLPVAEIPRSIYDTAIQRAYVDFARTEQMEAQRGAQAFGIYAQAGPPSYPPVPASPNYQGVGAAVGDAVQSLMNRPGSGYQGNYAGAYHYGGTPGVGVAMNAMEGPSGYQSGQFGYQGGYGLAGWHETPAYGQNYFNYGQPSSYFGQSYSPTSGYGPSGYGTTTPGAQQGSLSGFSDAEIDAWADKLV